MITVNFVEQAKDVLSTLQSEVPVQTFMHIYFRPEEGGLLREFVHQQPDILSVRAPSEPLLREFVARVDAAQDTNILLGLAEVWSKTLGKMVEADAMDMRWRHGRARLQLKDVDPDKLRPIPLKKFAGVLGVFLQMQNALCTAM